jgi:hypothetical protein
MRHKKLCAKGFFGLELGEDGAAHLLAWFRSLSPNRAHFCRHQFGA